MLFNEITIFIVILMKALKLGVYYFFSIMLFFIVSKINLVLENWYDNIQIEMDKNRSESFLKHIPN